MCQRKYALSSLIAFLLISVASSNNITTTSLSPLSITTTTSSAIGTRYIQSPWPWVVGHVAFSICLAIFGLLRIEPGPSKRKVGFLTVLLQFLNFIISLGAIAVLVRHLIIGKISIPGVGVAIELWTLMIYNGTAKPQAGESRRSRVMYKLFSLSSMLLCMIGTVLYIVIGALVASKGLSNSILLIVNTGCDDACYNEYPNQRIRQSVGGDTNRMFAWAISAGLLGLGLTIHFSNFVYQSYRSHTLVFPHPGQIRLVAFWLVLGGGPLAISAAVLDRRAGQGTFFDCQGAQLILTDVIFNISTYSPCFSSSIAFPGSASGFWELWATSKIALVEGLVVW
ncbi:hypothetical protein V8E51_001489 [Hyaloscypha variabilis]